MDRVFGRDNRDTGRASGFAFVEMDREADAPAAIEAMSGTYLDGRDLKVNEAQERQLRRDGGGW